MSRGFIIAFFGPDGSGKSTLAKALTEKLNRGGFKTKLSWMRGTHTVASLLAKVLSRFATFKGSNNPYYGIAIPGSFKKLWQLLEFVSILPILLTRFLIPSWLGRVVIAERYIPDFLMWVSLTTKDSNYLRSLSAKLLLALVLKAKTKIYVTAEYTELIRRSGSNPEFIKKQLMLYELLAEALNAYRLDTTGKDVSESANRVLSLLKL